jgi:site-specific recombinase XerD
VRLLFSTDDLEIGGRRIPGFPLLIDDECYPLQPAQDFLFHFLLERGTANSPLTWEATGRRLYDYFAFLNANELHWTDSQRQVGTSVLSRYRDWSAGELKLSPSTINKRLSLVVKFYEWASEMGQIERLPFSYRSVRVSRKVGMLAHTKRGHQLATRASVLLREFRAPIRILTIEQIQVCREFLINPSHRLLFELMLRSGLRSCEARTYPANYVFDPASRNDLMRGQMIRVDLNPNELSIKYSKPRTIDVPWTLMEEMQAYKSLERETRRRRRDNHPTTLILSADGAPLARTSLVGIFRELSRTAGFPVTAHMLRHTYATFTLAALRKRKDFLGEPLLYVRDRMGHADVQTTAEYLHLINHLEAQLTLSHEDFVDGLFSRQALS